MERQSTVSVPETLQSDPDETGGSTKQPALCWFPGEGTVSEGTGCKAGGNKKSALAKQTAIKGVRRGEAAILTQLEGGEEVNDSLYVMGTAAKPAEKLWKDRSYRKAEQELKVKQADGEDHQ